MQYRWITIPALAIGMLALAVNDGLAQRSSRGSYSPEDVWARYGGGSGDTIDLNKNPQTAMMIKMKGYSVPPDGILRKDQFLPQVAARMQSMGGPPGGMGGPPPSGMGGPPPTATTGGGGDKPAVILVPGEETPGSSAVARRRVGRVAPHPAAIAAAVIETVAAIVVARPVGLEVAIVAVAATMPVGLKNRMTNAPMYSATVKPPRNSRGGLQNSTRIKMLRSACTNGVPPRNRSKTSSKKM